VTNLEWLSGGRFVALVEAAPDAMVCVDADGRIALVNAQTERLFGYGRDELVGEPVEMLVPDQLRGLHLGHRAGYVANPRIAGNSSAASRGAR
jgi:PAS domain S-box-containing protein